MNMKTIGERVRWARTERGLTQFELDEIADLSCGHSGAIERGRRDAPSTATMSKLAYALGVDLSWLIRGGKAPTLKKARAS
jgi:transcriptional regulator with XRE-family HTH domain